MHMFFVILVVTCILLSVFFFFKQKTAYEMRISDWSSDVCSSDLHLGHRARRYEGADVAGLPQGLREERQGRAAAVRLRQLRPLDRPGLQFQDRKRVV